MAVFAFLVGLFIFASSTSEIQSSRRAMRSLLQTSECCSCTQTIDEIGCSASASCSSIICEIDSWCCSVSWDFICTNLAQEICDEASARSTAPPTPTLTGTPTTDECQPGYDNDENGECSIPMACWGSDSHLLGDQQTAFNDVPGCGMTSCDDRYDKENVAACNEWCRTTTGCVAYSWTSYSGDQSHPGVKTCTIYAASQGTPTQKWETNQIFCEVCGLAAAHQGLPEQDLLTFVHQHNDIKDSTWTELLAINAAVSAAVSLFVMALFLTVWCLCARSKKYGTHTQVEKLSVDVDEEEEKFISA